MATDRDLELLDDYIANRLSGDDKNYIEEKLGHDPDLQSEYGIQQQIAAGIQRARVAELKQMLNTIPVPPIDGSPKNSYVKGIATAIVVLLGLSALYYFTRPDMAGESSAVVAVESLTVEAEPVHQQETTEEIIEDRVPENPETTRKEKPKLVQKSEEDNAATNLSVFDPTDDEEEDENIPAGSEQSNAVSVRTSEMIVETDNSDRKHTFHYQVSGEKLILYGAFEKNLYEILEFFTGENRTIFLYYKNSYYLLKPNGGKVSPLVPVNDPALLKKLREHRNGEQ